MKSSLLSASIAAFLAAGVTATSVSLHAAARCPGNIVNVIPRLVAGALIVIPAKINQSGPFDFMVDTGSQTTVIDPSLALHLNL
jgi:hypothetical protein